MKLGQPDPGGVTLGDDDVGAWWSSRSTVAVARVLGMISSPMSSMMIRPVRDQSREGAGDRAVGAGGGGPGR